MITSEEEMFLKMPCKMCMNVLAIMSKLERVIRVHAVTGRYFKHTNNQNKYGNSKMDVKASSFKPGRETGPLYKMKY